MRERRVDFRKGSFDNLIKVHGYYLDLYHAIKCPCVDQTSGAPDPNCRYCSNGWQYYGKEEIRGVMMNLDVEKQFSESGGFLLGSAMLTVQATTDLAYHDRIVNRKSVMSFNELIVRGSAATDKTRFPIVESLRIVGKNGVVYLPDTDFTINEGQIQWLGNAPTPGDYYSVLYKMRPSYLCLQSPHVVRDTHIKFHEPAPVHHRLPIQALCRLEFLVEE